ncbi:unnamed protein product, partial [Ixodes persulcatus]
WRATWRSSHQRKCAHRSPSCQLEVFQAKLRTVRDCDRSKEQVRRTKGCTAADSSGNRRHRRVQHIGLRVADSDRSRTGKSAQRCGTEVRQLLRAQKKRSVRPIPTAMQEARAGSSLRCVPHRSQDEGERLQLRRAARQDDPGPSHFWDQQ